MSVEEWENIALWWSGRFNNSEQYFNSYKEHRDFDRLREELSTKTSIKSDNQLEVVYDPQLTTSKIKTVLDKKLKGEHNFSIIVVDYLNQVRRSHAGGRAGQYDWTEQIEVSKFLKSMAQEYEVPILSPYQTDATGEARFAKGILDAADAAYSLEAWTQEDQCVTFNCAKMRNGSQKSFTSVMNWETLKIGPDSSLTPKEREALAKNSSEEINDI